MTRVFQEIGRFLIFFFKACQWLVKPPYRISLFVEQLDAIADKSVFIICLTGVFTGLVSTIQFYYGFQLIRPDELVGPTTVLGLARELAPTFTAIVVTGRAGAAMAAQIGAMRVTEQIDAIEVMAVNPIQYLVSPRIFAGFLSLPVLTTLFLFIGSVAAYFAGVDLLGIDRSVFYLHLRDFVFVRDLVQGLIKAAVYGIMFSSISAYMGFYASGGARGVGKATNLAVVVTLVLILIGDYFLTLVIRALFYHGVKG